MNTTLNHAPRKQLSHEIDRLNGILDGLEVAIPDVIAEAVRTSMKHATQEAVQAAITKLMSNPDLLRLLQGQASPPPMPTPSMPPSPTSTSILSRVSRSIWSGACSATRQVGRVMSSVGNTAWAVVKAPISLAARCARPVVATMSTLARFGGMCLALRPI
jgi:hypothetical protein